MSARRPSLPGPSSRRSHRRVTTSVGNGGPLTRDVQVMTDLLPHALATAAPAGDQHEPWGAREPGKATDEADDVGADPTRHAAAELLGHNRHR